MRIALTVLSLLVLSACGGGESASPTERARALAQDAIIVDGHIDVPYRMTVWEEDVTKSTPGGDFDYPRAKSGGLDAPFMSIYIPAALQGKPERTQALADSLIDLVEGIAARAPDKFAVATSPDQVRANHAAGIISLPMGMENGTPIADNPELLRHFFDRGIRYITLTHGKDNGLSDSSYDTTGTWNGLSPLGLTILGRMNQLGIMVDISHLSDSAAFDVLRESKAPVIASHSSARHFTPGWERNMDDDLIEAVAANGGVVMINFGSSFLDSRYAAASDSLEVQLEAAYGGSEPSSQEAFLAGAKLRRDTPVGSLDDVVAHINHVRDLVGVSHIGLGSDFDGVTALPNGLQDVSMYPNLVEALIREGYSDEEIRAILGENLLRVWSQVEAFAHQSQVAP